MNHAASTTTSFATRACVVASVVCVALLAGCSSPPAAPTVDDTIRRPVNKPETLALQTCKSELSATKASLTEEVTSRRAVPAVRLVGVTPSGGPLPLPIQDTGLGSNEMRIEPNQVATVVFELGASNFNPAPPQREDLIKRARAAKFIVVRGRTDAAVDSALQTNLAKRRAQAAFEFLTTEAGIPAQLVRVTWQGAGDYAAAGDSAASKQANRRVELEFYPIAPNVLAAAR